MTPTPNPRSSMQRRLGGAPTRSAPAAARRRLLTALLATAIPCVSSAQETAPSMPVPTPIEQALLEFACRVPGQAMASQEVYETCLSAQLQALRTDFGRDLRKLSAAERKRIDTACAKVRTLRGRDAYVGCMSEQLAAVRARQAKRARAVPARAAQPAEPISMPIEQAAAMLASSTEPPVAQPSSLPWLGLVGCVIAAASGWYVVAGRRKRPVVHLCRVCGGDAGTAGDMCPNCRHEAAEAQRRAHAEREHQLRALTEATCRAQEEAEARALEQAREREEAARRAEALAQQAELERQESARRERISETKRWQDEAAAAIAGPVTQEIDPHAILGVAKTASEPEIRAAYDEGRAKYAPEQVSHLGIELQDHYRRKAELVERAFEALTSPARV